MILYFIRHGETDWNCKRRMQGETNVPLNENGRKLAKKTQEGLKGIKFDLVISSPYIRAQETAKIVIGYDSIPFMIDPRIREISWGIWDGKTQNEIFKLGFEEQFKLFYTEPFSFKGAPGGESINQVCKRGKEFYEELIKKEDIQDKKILIATHGCALRGILNHLYEDSSDFWQGGVPANCSMTIISVKDGKSTFIERDKVLYDTSLVPDYYTYKE